MLMLPQVIIIGNYLFELLYRKCCGRHHTIPFITCSNNISRVRGVASGRCAALALPVRRLRLPDRFGNTVAIRRTRYQSRGLWAADANIDSCVRYGQTSCLVKNGGTDGYLITGRKGRGLDKNRNLVFPFAGGLIETGRQGCAHVGLALVVGNRADNVAGRRFATRCISSSG